MDEKVLADRDTLPYTPVLGQNKRETAGPYIVGNVYVRTAHTCVYIN